MDEFAIDPEAGIPAGDSLDSLGTSQTYGEGTNEGFLDQVKRRTRRPPQSSFYEQIGSALQAQQAADQQRQANSLLGGAYDPNWLATQEHAGSAEGQHL